MWGWPQLGRALVNLVRKEVLDLLEMFLIAVRKYGGLHFLILVRGMHDEKFVTALKHLCDGVIEFERRERGTRLEGTMRIPKLRGLYKVDKLIAYGIEERGIAIETAMRVV